MSKKNLTLVSLCFLGSILTACGDDGAATSDDADETGETGDGDGDGDGDDPTTGDGDGDPDPTTGDGDGDDDLDTEPPTVLSIEPANGAIGVLPDAVITIVFSEPMAKTATQSAYQSADLSSAEVTMAWNDAGDTLTITPNDPLEVAEGPSADAVEAAHYAFSLTTVAQDLAGNGLAESAVSEFDVARRMIMWLDVDPDMTGSVIIDGSDVAGYLAVGDAAEPANSAVRLVVTFDMAEVPEVVLAWEDATLWFEQIVVTESVYEDLGNIHVSDVGYAGFEDAFLAEGPDLGVFSDSPELGNRSIAVQQALADDHAVAAPNTQFRFEFEQATDWDGEPDLVFFESETLALEIICLIP